MAVTLQSSNEALGVAPFHIEGKEGGDKQSLSAHFTTTSNSMVDQPNLQEPRDELICCCASGPIFLIYQGGAKDMPIPTWSREWIALKAALAQLAHSLVRVD
jgi:hypothetical protein